MKLVTNQSTQLIFPLKETNTRYTILNLSDSCPTYNPKIPITTTTILASVSIPLTK